MSGWTEDGLLRSWRVLAHQEANEDWRFVHLARLKNVSIEAGCHFPNGCEALIVSFPISTSFDASRLPKGKGFDVVCIEGQSEFSGSTAVGIVRRAEGSLDIFAIIAVDILKNLELATTSFNIIEAFLERIREWQAFMERNHRPLSLEAQIGLFGELWILRFLISSSIGVGALDCWHGPLRAAQDFSIRAGAVEVKSTIRAGSFLARINSIEQLDCDKAPLFLCALRFEEHQEGLSLVELVSELREKFRLAGVQRAFEALIMVMGYIDDHASLYSRIFVLKDARAFLIDENMPRLKRAALPAPIRSAAYVLDLDALDVSFLELREMTVALGLKET